jgi:hypothetical protein
VQILHANKVYPPSEQFFEIDEQAAATPRAIFESVN